MISFPDGIGGGWWYSAGRGLFNERQAPKVFGHPSERFPRGGSPALSPDLPDPREEVKRRLMPGLWNQPVNEAFVSRWAKC